MVWTIQRLLNWITSYFSQKGIDSPRLSAELLLSEVLQMERIELYTGFETPVCQSALEQVRGLVKRAARHEPVSYLTGRAEFYSLKFHLSRDCLIPRPETEILTGHSIEFLRGREGTQSMCELGTGCGCIAVAVARNVWNVSIIATDISEAALETAEKNIQQHCVAERVKLLCGDLFEALSPERKAERFDLIVSNPPYVSISEYENLAENIREYEPAGALLAGEDGLEFHRRIISESGTWLKSGGALMLEMGYNQASAITKLLKESGCYGEIRIEKDFGNNARVAIARKPE